MPQGKLHFYSNIVYRCVEDEQLTDSKRGKYKRSTEKRHAIEKHIMSYGPTVSHYRREHAPNRYYLPSDLSASDMYKDFQNTHGATAATYVLYCKKMREMKISLVKLGKEECELCVTATLHQKNTKHPGTITTELCKICTNYDEHKRNAQMCRVAYRLDGDTVMSGTLVLAVDLQKVS